MMLFLCLLYASQVAPTIEGRRDVQRHRLEQRRLCKCFRKKFFVNNFSISIVLTTASVPKHYLPFPATVLVGSFCLGAIFTEKSNYLAAHGSLSSVRTNVLGLSDLVLLDLCCIQLLLALENREVS